MCLHHTLVGWGSLSVICNPLAPTRIIDSSVDMLMCRFPDPGWTPRTSGWSLVTHTFNKISRWFLRAVVLGHQPWLVKPQQSGTLPVTWTIPELRLLFEASSGSLLFVRGVKESLLTKTKGNSARLRGTALEVTEHKNWAHCPPDFIILFLLFHVWSIGSSFRFYLFNHLYVFQDRGSSSSDLPSRLPNLWVSKWKGPHITTLQSQEFRETYLVGRPLASNNECLSCRPALFVHSCGMGFWETKWRVKNQRHKDLLELMEMF